MPWFTQCCARARRETLKRLSARHLRLLFVMSPWNQPMSYSEGALAEARPCLPLSSVGRLPDHRPAGRRGLPCMLSSVLGRAPATCSLSWQTHLHVC